jgi:hypothetical protein
MDDLDLLRRMVGEAPALDETTRARMRASLDERMESAPVSKRRSRRSAVVVILVAAGVGVGTLAAAAGLTHLWSQGQPVAIPLLPGYHSGGSDGQPDDNSLAISNPMKDITSAAEFEATVAEFAPAIRLPEGHDFTTWMQHVERVTDFTSADGRWYRSLLAGDMVFVAECQWGQRWLDSNQVGDSAGMSRSIDVLGGIAAWSFNAGIENDGFMQNVIQQMKDGDTIMLQQWLGVNCGNTGSVIGSQVELDGLAQDMLVRALTTARQFYDVGDTYSGFGVLEAEKTAPAFAWTAPDWVPAAGPGQPNIAVADGQRLVLTGESESGTIFCIEVRQGVTTYGRVAAGSGIDANVVCEAGGWQYRSAG